MASSTYANPEQLLLATEAVSDVRVHPIVAMQILDRSLRSGEEQRRVIGSLLGRYTPDGTGVEVTSSFAVPHLESGDEVAVGKDFHTQMYELHQRVNEGEVVVGWYATTPEDASGLVDEHSCLIHEFYRTVCDNPVHLVIDTRADSDNLQLAAFISAPLEVVDDDAATPTHQFKQVQVSHSISDPEAIALDAMTVKDADKSDQAPLQSDLTALEQSMEKLYECLDQTSQFVDDVVAGKSQADAHLGREIVAALDAIPAMRQEQFDQVFTHGVQDLLMVSYLSGLTQAQLSVAEKLLHH